jgi:hypothetical protein
MSDVSYRDLTSYFLLAWYAGINVAGEYVASIIMVKVIYTPNIEAVCPT